MQGQATHFIVFGKLQLGHCIMLQFHLLWYSRKNSSVIFWILLGEFFFLFSFNVHCLVSLNMHCWFVSFPAFFFLMLLEGQKFSSSLHPPDQMGSRQHSMRLILIFVSGPLFGAHATKLEVPGSIPCRVLENFQATSSSLSAFSNPGVHSIPNRSDFQEMFLR